jgi:hypothetical protein
MYQITPSHVVLCMNVTHFIVLLWFQRTCPLASAVVLQTQQ